jgi:predicted DNA-binding protein (MmcQ/YjbR family)
MSLSPDALRAILEAMPGASGEALPSARGVTLFKVMGKMFAILNDHKSRYVIVKCDPHLIDILKQQYAGVAHRSHLDKRFWIALDLGADVPDETIERLVGGSYDLIRAGLTKKQRAALDASAR